MKRYTSGGRGEGGYPILTLILNIPGWLALKKCVLNRGYTHISYKKKAATRIGIAASYFLLLNPVYALEVYWTARAGEEFESLVMAVDHFGNGENRGRESARVRSRRPTCSRLEKNAMNGALLLPSECGSWRRLTGAPAPALYDLRGAGPDRASCGCLRGGLRRPLSVRR